MDKETLSPHQNHGIIISTSRGPQQHNFLPTMYGGNPDLEHVFANQDDLDENTLVITEDKKNEEVEAYQPSDKRLHDPRPSRSNKPKLFRRHPYRWTSSYPHNSNGETCKPGSPSIMIGLSWNCRGFGNPRTIQMLCELNRTRKLDFIFLTKTLARNTKISQIKMRLGFEGMVNVDCAGRAGGLAFLWRKGEEFSLLGFSQNHIDMAILENNTQQWRITGFYDHPDRSQRGVTWDLLITYKAKHNVRSAMVCNW